MASLTINGCFVAAALLTFCCAPLGAQHFNQTNLTSNTSGAANTDPNLVNPWGMSRSSGSPWWFSDNGSNLSTLYTGAGATVPLAVSVPGGPTGTVFNGTTGFLLNGKPASFLFATESGKILAWNGGTAATVVASKNGAVYKGLALATVNGAPYLYAADFAHGAVDVLNAGFQYVRPDGDDERRAFSIFEDDEDGMRDFAPFNVQNIGGNLFVTYARQDSTRQNEVHGAGLGVVASFTPGGRLIRVFQRGSWLNAPWGLAEAPGDFGPFSHNLLVGNFGSGQIAAYNEQTGRFVGLFQNASGATLTISGLWGLSFGGDNTRSGNATTLFFTAGPNDENGGLFGSLTPVATDLTQGNGN